jgi:hypothetical protein
MEDDAKIIIGDDGGAEKSFMRFAENINVPDGAKNIDSKIPIFAGYFVNFLGQTRFRGMACKKNLILKEHGFGLASCETQFGEFEIHREGILENIHNGCVYDFGGRGIAPIHNFNSDCNRRSGIKVPNEVWVGRNIRTQLGSCCFILPVSDQAQSGANGPQNLNGVNRLIFSGTSLPGLNPGVYALDCTSFVASHSDVWNQGSAYIVAAGLLL